MKKIKKKFESCPPIASMHDFFPRVRTFLLFISLKWGCIIIGTLCVVHCYLHVTDIKDRDHRDNSNKKTLTTLWVYIFYWADISLAVFGFLLIIAVKWGIRLLATLWIFAALQNAILVLVFEYFASPLHYEEKDSKEAFEDWPKTLLHCIIPFVLLYCIYVVNSWCIECPKKQKKPPRCKIPMTDFK